MKLEEIGDWTIAELQEDIAKGGKFVIFTYAISIIIATFRRPSGIYYIKSDEYSISHGWPYFLISLFLGWWGFPYGPIYTLESLWFAFAGENFTKEVMEQIMQNMTDENDDINFEDFDYDTERLMRD